MLTIYRTLGILGLKIWDAWRDPHEYSRWDWQFENERFIYWTEQRTHRCIQMYLGAQGMLTTNLYRRKDKKEPWDVPKLQVPGFLNQQMRVTRAATSCKFVCGVQNKNSRLTSSKASCKVLCIAVSEVMVIWSKHDFTNRPKSSVSHVMRKHDRNPTSPPMSIAVRVSTFLFDSMGSQLDLF